MNQKNKTLSLWKAVDIQSLFIYLLLITVGWLTIYSASYNFDSVAIFDLSSTSGKQLIWIAVSVLVGISILIIDARFYYYLSYNLYIALLFLLLLTILIAPEIKGSRSWLVFGPLSIQPAEFAKFATALALSRFLADYGYNIKDTKRIVLLFTLLFIPVGMIFLQKETGTALVFLAFLLVFYREGMSGLLLFVGACLLSYFVVGLRFGEQTLWEHTSMGNFSVLLLIALVMSGLFFRYHKKDNKTWLILLLANILPVLAALLLNRYTKWGFDIAVLQLVLLSLSVLYALFQSIRINSRIPALIALFTVLSTAFLYGIDYTFDRLLQPHQQTRILVLLGTMDDPSGVGYNVNQAKISIGSGGFWGKGYLNGTQTKLKYVPEQDTDFIFCTIGEEFGFAGSAMLLIIYSYLLIRLIFMANRQRFVFARIYGYCVASLFFVHLLVNVGMVLGLMPVIGIPLPFLSYGGSSLLGFTILLFIFLRLDADNLRRH
ncbi:MAG: rod shape-determining protein RodA [Bacteroidales bacterium]|nr:rod shape-determining protein RodA [Bacteroidales bacterium]MDD4641706.1 rod shape-determining protein RodA [Bacteroidales bacterium]